jgi:large conductance mechanosensitive channel
MWGEFKEFVSRGNVVELAIAVIIGAAFGKIVDSFVEDMIMPLLGIILGGVNLEALQFKVGSAVVLYGNFIQTLLDFILISIAIFIVIKVLNRYYKRKKEMDEGSEDVNEITDTELLTEIRDILKRNEKADHNETVVRFRKRVK